MHSRTMIAGNTGIEKLKLYFTREFSFFPMYESDVLPTQLILLSVISRDIHTLTLVSEDRLRDSFSPVTWV
jgi:hypothetical protein